MQTTGLIALSAALALGCTKAPPEPKRDDPPATSAAPPGSSVRLGHLPLHLMTALSASAPARNEGHEPPGGDGGASSPHADAGGGLAWDAPQTWMSVPNPNPMRKATYKIPKSAGDTEDAEMTVSAAAGGVEANVERWAKQFGDAKAKTETRTVHGLKVTVVELRGTFSGGGPMMGAPTTPKPNQMLLGAIVDHGEKHEKQEFFKLVGGEKTVSAARKDFEKLVASLRAD